MRTRQAVALLALVGWFVALYLWFYKIGLLGSLQCGTGSCEDVQASRYAEFLGVPVAFYGVGGYAAVFAVALLSIQPTWAARRGPIVLLATLSSLGFLFTLYLTFVELFVLHAVCRWCVASAVIITAIWALAMWGVRRNN